MFQEHGVLRAGGGAWLGMGWGGGTSGSSGRAARGLRDAGVRSPGSGRSGEHKPCGAEGEIVILTITLVTRAMLATTAPAEAARRCIVVDSSPHPGHRPVAAEGPAAGAEAALESARKGTKQPALQKPLRSPPHRGCGLRTAQDDPRGQRPFGPKLHLIEAFEPKPGGHVLGSCHGDAYSLFSSASRCCSSLRLRIGGGVMT